MVNDETTKSFEANQVPTVLETLENRITKHSIAELLEGLQDESGNLSKAPQVPGEAVALVHRDTEHSISDLLEGLKEKKGPSEGTSRMVCFLHLILTTKEMLSMPTSCSLPLRFRIGRARSFIQYMPLWMGHLGKMPLTRDFQFSTSIVRMQQKCDRNLGKKEVTGITTYMLHFQDFYSEIWILKYSSGPLLVVTTKEMVWVTAQRGVKDEQ